MIPHLNISNIFTRSHPSKGENQKEICKPKQVLKFGCLSPGSHQSLLVICNTTYNLLFPPRFISPSFSERIEKVSLDQFLQKVSRAIPRLEFPRLAFLATAHVQQDPAFLREHAQKRQQFIYGLQVIHR